MPEWRNWYTRATQNRVPFRIEGSSPSSGTTLFYDIKRLLYQAIHIFYTNNKLFANWYIILYTIFMSRAKPHFKIRRARREVRTGFQDPALEIGPECRQPTCLPEADVVPDPSVYSRNGNTSLEIGQSSEAATQESPWLGAVQLELVTPYFELDFKE